MIVKKDNYRLKYNIKQYKTVKLAELYRFAINTKNLKCANFSELRNTRGF